MVAIIDYARASMNFIQKDNIAVTGHSMGGMISLATLITYGSLEAQGKGKSPITAILEVGFDPTSTIPLPIFKSQLEKYPVNWGIIAAKYDEWFFKSPDVGGDPRKLLRSNEARTFVNQLEGVKITGNVENSWVYKGSINGGNYFRVT